MATYVNFLRLTELATGEGSGTWGNTTNTNLELIGEALGYATQQAFGSDADATTTVADGVSDPARAMYYKITSAVSLTTTRTLTIAPNTLSRVMFIENATSGSQSIAISQGSGANVTILTGKTAVVYLDGAGAGAAVVDAMAGVDPGVTDTLAEVLTAGNTSGGTDIVMSAGDNITNASGDLTLDIAGDIILDAGGSEIRLSKAGTEFGKFATDIGTPSGFAISSSVLDGDIDFQGNDGGSTITALTLDMSEAGAATFNAGATFGSGIDVTGSVTADGLTVDGDASISSANARLRLFETDTTDLNTQLQNQAGDFFIKTIPDDASTSTNRFAIDHATGDISFYNDAAAQGLFWDSSASALGIGTTTPDSPLEIQAATNSSSDTTYLKLYNAGENVGNIDFENGNGSLARITGTKAGAGASANDGILTFSTAFDASLAECMRIDANGNVGIGESSIGSNALEIRRSGASGIVLKETGVAQFYVEQDTDAKIRITNSKNLIFSGGTNGTTERMRIDASGNVGIGTSSPNTLAHLAAGAGSAVLRLENTDAFLSDNEVIGKIEFETQDAGGAGVNAYIQAAGVSIDGATKLEFGTGASNSPSTRMTINSNGNVGIGTNSPSAPLNVYNASNPYTKFEDAANYLNVGVITSNYGLINSSLPLSFQVNDTERLRIDASGNVGIGVVPKTTNATVTGSLNVNQAGLLVRNSNQAYFASNIYWDASDQLKSYGAGYGLASLFIPSDGSHRFFNTTAAATGADQNLTLNETMRIDSSGNLLVGKTTTTFGTAGIALRGTVADFTRDGGTPINVNRLTSDGSLIDLHKDGTVVGSIGTTAGDIQIGSGDTALRFQASTDSVFPAEASGGGRGSAIDLGLSSVPFKDLYLSGGVYLGGTGAANKLDDYEEGTFTPTLFGSGSSATTLLTALGRYVKVGKSVTCWIEISCNGSTTLPTGNYIALAGLPFSPVSSRAFTAVVSVTGLTGLAAGTYFVGATNSGTTVNLNKYNQDGVIGTVGLTAASLTSTFGATTSITYEAA